jgi:biotin carboxyl carrier protein
VETRLVHAGRTLVVRLDPDGDGFVAGVDGEERRVGWVVPGARGTAAGATVEELALVVDGRPCRALVARRPDHVLVALAGRVYRFETEAAREAGGRSAGSGTVTAPMPGKVVAVLVAEGDAVEAGQPLVVIEAMKMESTLAAEVAGHVARVHVVAGAMVDAGAVLVEVAAAAA